ncbi:MAG: hypothetical protein Q7N87_03325 [Candidatus Uhrbacteria bacterium]|nr:hypothetical protein [Candidatus Uhrbacteria bacterium]
MSHPLIPIGTLITESWHQFVRNWNQTLRFSVWFMVAPILMFLAALLTRSSPAIGGAIFFLFALLNVILATWIGIRLIIWILANDKNKTPEPNEARLAWSFFFPLIWVSLLTGLAVLGGLVLFVIPAIWLAINLLFAGYFLIEDNLRGTQSLAASWALVKGRWWGTFWRVIVAYVLFIIISIILVNILSAIFGIIVAPAKINYVFNIYNPISGDLMTIAGSYLVQGILNLLLLPLAITWSVKLFHSLKESKG